MLVGNPIMHHLVLGIDPTPLGTAPFTLATDEPVDAWADDIELDLPNAHLHVLPCIAGHVGADTAAAVLQEGPHRGDAVMLLVDVGHQRGDRARQPRAAVRGFEPDRPRVRRRAAVVRASARPTGAIERVRIDRDTLEPRIKVIGVDAWSDEPGVRGRRPRRSTSPACAVRASIEVIAELFLAGVILRDGTIDGAAAARSPRVVPDDRTFAYVLHDGRRPGSSASRRTTCARSNSRRPRSHAGVRLLIDHAAITGSTRVRLAGAFGNHIDPLYAIVLGLIPDCDPRDRAQRRQRGGQRRGAGAAVASRRAREIAGPSRGRS